MDNAESEQRVQHYESFYHCNTCRRVYYLEETDEKIVDTCEDCGPGTFFKITEADSYG